MTLASGRRLGPYEILSALGAGGMGEVYRATDSRLNRTVAIKILSEASAADVDRRERFEREAKAISALDHPNICALYDVGEHEGTYFLVMPCLEGETLADRLAKGAIPVEQAIKYAIEIATALDAAHRHGIIHRDLKPANIMLTKTGVKLLDFGLAKLKKGGGPLGDTTMVKGTGVGTLLGTMPYMSPEQVEGREVDARSDIFSLGAVIYEMVTGGRAFKGDSPASVIGAILKDEPALMTAVQPLAPSALDHVVTVCLAKDPDERWQSASDIGKELRWISSCGRVEPAVVPARRAWTERAAWIVVASVLGAAVVSPWREEPASPAIEARLFLNPPPGTTFVSGTPTTGTVPTTQFEISPDGRSVAFIAAVDEWRPTLWVRPLGSFEARQLPGTEGAQEPFWSPDNQWVGFFDRTRSMKRIPVSGGPVQMIAANISDPRGASWGRDDMIMFGTGSGGLFVVAASGSGPPRALTELDPKGDEKSHRWPELLPDGEHFLYTVRSGREDHGGTYVGSRDGRTKRLLLRTDGDVEFMPPGRVLFLDGDTLVSQALDDNLQLSGQTTPVAAGVGRSSRGYGAFSASSAGTLAYAGPFRRLGRLAWRDRKGNLLTTIGPAGTHDYVDARLSPDQARLTASIVNTQSSVPDVWFLDLARDGVTRLTFGPLNSAAVWSPQGDRIAFRTNRAGVVELYQKSAGAGGAEEPLMTQEVARRAGIGLTLIPTDWSPDGRLLALTANSPTDIWMLPIGSDASPFPMISSPGDQMHGNFSPDGRLIAYTSNESGQQHDVYVETVPRSNQKWSISTSGGSEPRWRADGQELYYLAADGTLMAVAVSSPKLAFGIPQPLFRAGIHRGVSHARTNYVASSDGTRFLVNMVTDDVTQAAINVVLNWNGR